MQRLGKLFVLLVGVAFIFSLSTCDGPMGLGDPIDWEPPILVVDPIPTPLYVTNSSRITGTASDNIGVTRVFIRDANKKDNNGNSIILGDAELGTSNLVLDSARGVNVQSRTWVIEFDFSQWKCKNGHVYNPGINAPEEDPREWLYSCRTCGLIREPETVMAEIVAFDKMENSGEKSIAAITLVIDVRPPIIDDMWIERTTIRRADLEVYSDLKNLEITDMRAERSANVNRYQNGFFHIQGKVSEEETRIDRLTLNIYDYREINTPLMTLVRDADSSAFSPRWLISETALLNAGEAKWPGYKNSYYTAGCLCNIHCLCVISHSTPCTNANSCTNWHTPRYYYRVAVIAEDRSNNESEPFFITEEEGTFVMWQDADIPKGVLDPLIGTQVSKGGTLPVEFFDDDQILFAYTALFTKEQWDGERPIASGVFITTGVPEEEKREFVRNRLRNNDPVYNWKYDRYAGNASVSVSEQVNELIGGKKLDERLIYVQTGNNDADYGTFVLFSLTADSKLSPHTNIGPNDTNKTREALRSWVIYVLDENAPVIVLDVQKGCPEENTFPSLTNGERFTINGYTLRESGRKGNESNNGVVKFRMAWVPSRMSGGSDSHIQAVQNALSDVNYPAIFENNGALNGVQYWDFNFSDYPNNIPINYTNSSYEEIPAGSNNMYRNQPFQREFSILGNNVSNVNNPATNPAWKDFHSIDGEGNYTLENTTKLFILYAEDNMGLQVFRQMRLLGNNTPPEIVVYDITGKVHNNSMPSGIPDMRSFTNDGVVADTYFTQLSTYNNNTSLYDILKGASLNIEPEFKTIPFQAYPRETILKYWVTADRTGDLAIKSITMMDITYEGADRYMGLNPMNAADMAMVFAEYYPDELQRVYLFEAEDTLGNVARIQRTIAITNTAMLESITTTTQNGTYGITKEGEEIILQANFTGQIRVNTAGGNPRLNVRYPIYSTNSSHNGEYHIQQIEAEPVIGSAMSLQFKFKVPNPDTFSCIDSEINQCPNKGHGGVPIIAFGKLETMYDTVGMGGSAAVESVATNRPIALYGAVITDALREGQPAFIPGYTIGTSTMHTWTTSVGSLQNPTGKPEHEKDIRLDAVRPVISSASVGGKTAYTGQEYYFKNGETLTITLTSSGKAIKSSSTEPRLQYYIQENPVGSPQGVLRGPYNATTTPESTFKYTRSSGSNALVFSLPISDTQYDGEIVQISLVTADGHGAIEDDVGNTVLSANVSNLIPSGTRIFVKKALPAAPAATLGNGNAALQTAGPNFNYSPVLTVPVSTAVLAAWEDKREYSLNGGLSWTEYTSTVTIGNGSHGVRVRYVDRAGNNGTESTRDIVVNANFPRLLGVTVEQGNGTYRIGQRLDLEMSFADTVSYTNAANVTITLRDITNTSATDNTMQLRATGGSGTSTIRFAWTGNTGTNPFIDKDMLTGLRITGINMSGLSDSFGNIGPASANIGFTNSSPWDINMPALGTNAAYSVRYTISGTIVSTIAPTIRSRQPQNAQGRTGNITLYTADPDTVSVTDIASGSISTDNKTIRLTFSKPMQKGNGTITIRPHSDYAIPVVLENEGYYLHVDLTTGVETVHTSAGTDRTWIAGFSDIFNNVNDADKITLIGTTSMANPALSQQTGLSVGPYLKTTHGLKQGQGFTGDYRNNTGTASITNPGINAPGPRGTTSMVPDTSTKWVLRYDIEDIFATTTTTAAPQGNIRAVLDRAKFRWQEIAVTHQTNVTISGNTVTINLAEPLLPGLHWTLHYDAGTFTDIAGNPATGIAKDAYWFWSSGVQKPVIRVDRKSYDARASANFTGSTSAITYNDTNAHMGTIASYNAIAYRITSETPQARIYYGTRLGTASTVDDFPTGSVTGDWTGRVNTTTAANIDSTAAINWNGPKNEANTEFTGRWVRPNLIFRNSHNGAYVVMEDGIDVPRSMGVLANNQAGIETVANMGYRYLGLRSYNRDASFSDLNAVDLDGNAGTLHRVTASFTYDAYQASKNYVAANARIDHKAVQTNGSHNYTSANYTSQKGYEGVFRTVFMMHQAGVTGSNTNPPKVNGSTRQSGLPTIAGFPLKDNATGTDRRYMKVMYRNNNQFYWVSSEIVSQWFLQVHGRGDGNADRSFSRQGDSADWITAGYGDLTYSFNVMTW